MNFFHYITYNPPWALGLALTGVLALAGVLIPYRWYRKVANTKVLAWTHSILTGVAVGFVVGAAFIIVSANQINAVEQENKTALRAFAENDYGLKLNDENLNLLYWSKDEGEVPVDTTNEAGELQQVYLKATKDGWLLYDKTTKKALSQTH